MQIHSTEMLVWYTGTPDKDGEYIVKFKPTTVDGHTGQLFTIAEYANGIWRDIVAARQGFEVCLNTANMESYTQIILAS
jgi:hypothetical protein